MGGVKILAPQPGRVGNPAPYFHFFHPVFDNRGESIRQCINCNKALEHFTWPRHIFTRGMIAPSASVFLWRG
jgi:hypothetical protein